MAATVISPGKIQNEAQEAARHYLNERLTKRHEGSIGPFVVPIIDISKSFQGPQSERQAIASKIRAACLNSGFFQITGHGVSATARQSILAQASRFFKTLTPAQKEKLHVKHSKYLRGWEPSDYTYVDPSDWGKEAAVPETKEGFNWGYEPKLDPTGGDGKFTELDGSKENGNIWPDEDELPGFFEGVKQYYAEVLSLARCLSRLFALALELPGDYFDEMTTHPGGIGRLLFYPPADPTKADEIGLGAHSDYECFTILLSSMKQGLEILSPDGVWTAVDAVENGLIVNIGDFFMRLTNGLYKSTVHRVINPTPEERYSVPFFFSINYDQLVETLPSCISEQNPCKYPPVRAGEYILGRLQATTKEESS